MNIYHFSHLARPVDINYPTNRWIALISLAMLLFSWTWQLYMNLPLLTGLIWAMRAALSVFITWAVAREIDPDREYAAFVAVALALPIIFIYGPADASISLWLLLFSRIINRSIGPAAKLIDSCTILIFSIWLTYTFNWTFSLFAALAFIMDSHLAPKHSRHFLFALLALLISTLFFSWQGNLISNIYYGHEVIVIVTAILLMIPVVIRSNQPAHSMSDLIKHPLSAKRIQAAQIFALVFSLHMSIWQPEYTFTVLIAPWASFIGIGLYNIFAKIRLAGTKQNH